MVRQSVEWAAAGDNVGVTPLALAPVLAGSRVLVFVQDVNFNGNPMGSGAPYAVSVADSQGGSYTNLGYVTTTAYDAITVFVRNAGVTAGALTVTTTWGTNQWHGTSVHEIANVGASPTVTLLGGNESVNPDGADAVATQTAALGSSPALLVAVSEHVAGLPGTAKTPLVGTGFTSVLPVWNWNGAEGTSTDPSSIVESRYVANPGAIAATFTSASAPTLESFISIGVAFQ
jgi:hypothetical protein